MSRYDRRELLAIFLGGAVGAVGRIALTKLPVADAPSWPWIIFAINVSGAFALGYFVTRLQERLPLSTYRRPLLGTGFCGALTTFSTVQVELLKMIDVGHYGTAAGYAVASILAGYAAVHVASAAVRRARTIT